MKQDKQPRRPSKQDLPADKLHPASDMGKRAKGGDKFANQGLPKRQKSAGPTTTATKPRVIITELRDPPVTLIERDGTLTISR